MLCDFGLGLPVRIWIDSSAAIGISSRQGLGKLRHVDTRLLWVQQAVRQRRLELRKVAGTSNPADVFTKYPASREKLIALTAMFDCFFAGGRAASAPKLRREKGSKKTLGDEEPGPPDLDEHLGAVQPDDTARMPHLEYTPQTLDALYPPYNAPPGEVQHTEPQHNDALLEKGLRSSREVDAQRSYGALERSILRPC